MDTDCKHICDCECHTKPIMHFMACCYTCSHCDKNIVESFATQHETQCHGTIKSDK